MLFATFLADTKELNVTVLNEEALASLSALIELIIVKLHLNISHRAAPPTGHGYCLHTRILLDVHR